MRRSPRIFLCVIAACVTSYAAPSTLDPLVQVSGASPFVDCHDDFIEFQPGTVYVGSEVEPWLRIGGPTAARAASRPASASTVG